MRKNFFLIKIIAPVLVFAVAAISSGCAKPDDSSKGQQKSGMLVDLHSLMPSSSTVVSPTNPVVTVVSAHIAEQYEKLTGTHINWATDYGKPVDNIENMATWFNMQIQTKNCPAIGFSFGTELQADGIYEDLGAYLERPNKYVPGNLHWKDCFEDWVWDDPDVLDANGKIVSVPVLLNPGSATAMFYNKDVFRRNSLEVPVTWNEYKKAIDKFKMDTEIRYPMAPCTIDTRVALSSWAVQFNITPGYAKKLMAKTDYDKNGRTTTREQLRAVKENVYNPQVSKEAKDVYQKAFDYFKVMVPTGWASLDFTTAWNEGKIAMTDNGLWALPVENSNILRNFEFGVTIPPLVQSDTTALAEDLERKSIREGFQSNVLVAFNVMKPAVQDNPELLEKAIDFLMYLTTPDAVTALCQEHGGSLPAVKDSGHASLLDSVGWLDNRFYDTNHAEWPIAFTLDQNAIADSLFNDWVLGKISQSDFYRQLNQVQQTGADRMISYMNIDTAGWNI